MFIIRKAKKNDAKSLAELFYVFFNEEWINKYNNSKMKRFAEVQKIKKIDVAEYSDFIEDIKNSKDEIILVAEENESKKIVGFIAGEITKKEREELFKTKGHIEDLYVLKEYRNKKLGEILINAINDWFKKNKAFYSNLEVDIINAKGVKFYKRQGYEKIMYKMIKKL